MREAETAVLIVEDEPDICWALAHILKRTGIAAVTATSGRQALRLAKRHRFHLVFLDAKLPDIDGLDLACRLREANAGIRIVLVSGYFYRDDAEVHEAIAAGIISGFISKPIEHEEVRAIAREALAP
ncbi:MAG: response regulator [Planctomycetes bacterium]|nr:response regulator [Acidobacteriota bacterium]MBI3465570.1 response regulator [Planctomycetota bacterium]